MKDALRVEDLPTLFIVGVDGHILWHDEMAGNIEDALDAALWLRDHP